MLKNILIALILSIVDVCISVALNNWFVYAGTLVLNILFSFLFYLILIVFAAFIQKFKSARWVKVTVIFAVILLPTLFGIGMLVLSGYTLIEHGVKIIVSGRVSPEGAVNLTMKLLKGILISSIASGCYLAFGRQRSEKMLS